MQGKIVSLNISKKKGQKKIPVNSLNLIAGKGVEGDAHFSSERQVSLLPSESIQRMKNDGVAANPGSFAENITIEGIDLKTIGKGTRIKAGTSLMEIVEIGKDCHEPCNIYKQAGYCVMPEDGIFAKVIKNGEIKTGDTIEVIR